MEGFLQTWLVGFTYFLYTLFTQPLSKIGVVGNPWDLAKWGRGYDLIYFGEYIP